ncbi:MAG TPA: hypothetical protein VK550_02605 [Polyangiaceae bacterium]|nr:hypothetical protein [Polyangiaceae bacterium]
MLITACSSTRYPTRDGSPPRAPPEHADSQGDAPSGDTSPSDGEEPGLDAAIIDGTATDASLDGDGGCACDHIPSGIPQIPLNGVLPLSCYCEGGWAGFGAQWPQCMTYDESVACHRDLRERATVITYENCNLVTLSYGAGLVFDQRHFDATTHAFVGARRWVDHPVPMRI